MKKILFILCLVVSATMFYSCDKDNDDPIEPPIIENPDPTDPTNPETPTVVNSLSFNGYKNTKVETTLSRKGLPEPTGKRFITITPKDNPNVKELTLNFINFKGFADLETYFKVYGGKNLLQGNVGVLQINEYYYNDVRFSMDEGSTITIKSAENGIAVLSLVIKNADKQIDIIGEIEVAYI
jgi:hypothetical protein